MRIISSAEEIFHEVETVIEDSVIEKEAVIEDSVIEEGRWDCYWKKC